jgi:hypothetical protein
MPRITKAQPIWRDFAKIVALRPMSRSDEVVAVRLSAGAREKGGGLKTTLTVLGA